MCINAELGARLLVIAGSLLVLSMATKQQRKSLPGPKPLPFIGNLLDLPQERQWEAFSSWRKKYGDVVYLNIFGTSIVILNSMSACVDLLDKRSLKYSGRRQSLLLTKFMGFDYTFPLMDYTPRWRKHRRLFYQNFNERAVPAYLPIQERAVHHFLQRLLNKPDSFLEHMRLLFGETILNVVYDIKVESNDNPFIQAAEKAVEATLEVVIPGRFLVEFFPAMQYLPSWFPGGTFKKFAAKRRQSVLDARDLPSAYVKKCMDSGTAGPSVLRSMLEKVSQESMNNPPQDGEETPEDVAKSSAAVAYIAGADTVLSSVQAFFLAIANRPDIQEAAWKELDALLGASPRRLPNHGDEAQLPFIVAISKEILRWHNVVPLGVPHILTEDDEYNGHLLRKGTIVLANIWGVLHDPEVYDEPLDFNPWRWLLSTPEGPKLNPNMPTPAAAFGFGRRICPGRHFALNSLFITISSVLACFEVRPLDSQGRPTDRVNEDVTSGLVIYPTPYNISITPRSTYLAGLIKDLPA